MNAIRVPARVRRALVLMLVLLLPPTITLAGGSSQKLDPGSGGSPRVFPPGSNPYGASYGEWSARWWQWAFSLPVAGHPLYDPTGAECDAGQSGPVWFLVGTYGQSGTVVRSDCVVPAGKAILIPILNAEWDNVCPPDALTEEQLREQVKLVMDTATGLAAEVDGEPISLSQYRFTSPTFAVDFPAGNLFEQFCGTPAGHYEPFVADGYYIMLTPLSPGEHTIHIAGTLAAANFTLDVTYHLTVSPKGGTLTIDPIDPNVSMAPVTHASWGRVKGIYR